MKFPGWKMSVAQHNLYWRLFQAACRAQHATTMEARDALRHAAHRAAFNGCYLSATMINGGKQFDAIKAEFERLAGLAHHNRV